jgi:GNAT superfamily N-acetyltransferase
MTPEFRVRRLREEEWLSFRELRLRALKTDPSAFGSTFAKEAAYPDRKWQDWCRKGALGEDETTFVATDRSGRLVGMAGTFTDGGVPHVWGMWVRPECRRKSVARELMASIVGWYEGRRTPNPLLLDVNPSLEAAVRLYSSLGFEFNGVTQPLGHDPPAIARQMARRPGAGR